MNSAACVLLAEHDATVRRTLRAALQTECYTVVSAQSGAEALAKIERAPPDLVLLDISLPDMCGVDVTTAIRREHQMPIVILSACSDECQLIRALDAGATDCVTQPFPEGEFLGRVRAALRHGLWSATGSEIVVGDLTVQTVQRLVFVAGHPVGLTPTEFRLLSVLARDAGRVVTHQRLLVEVWGTGHSGDVQYLRVYMKQIRQKIGDNATRPRRISTVIGVGYRLSATG